MIFMVARIQKITEVHFDQSNRALCIRYQNAHRASGGKLFEVRFEEESLNTLLANISWLGEQAGVQSDK